MIKYEIQQLTTLVRQWFFPDGCVGVNINVGSQPVDVERFDMAVHVNFGGTLTTTGHKMFNEHIGLIYGDSITTQRCLDILDRLDKMGYASGNVMFGVGSFTYQCVTRDTFAFAVKATNTVVNGKSIAIFKDPKTDSKKKSAKGLLTVVKVGDELILLDNVTKEDEEASDNLLIRRFYNGQFFNMTTIDAIRARLS